MVSYLSSFNLRWSFSSPPMFLTDNKVKHQFFVVQQQKNTAFFSESSQTTTDLTCDPKKKVELKKKLVETNGIPISLLFFNIIKKFLFP